MLTKQLSNEICLFLEKYLEFYKSFLKVEQEKFKVISDNNIDKLDTFVVKEQALMLQSRGFELQRDQLIKKEIKDVITLKELVAQVDLDCRDKVSALHIELSNVLLDLKAINNSSNSLVELKLHSIDTNIKRLEKTTTQRVEYGNSARIEPPQKKQGGIISKKI